jgi:hypothetical protein
LDATQNYEVELWIKRHTSNTAGTFYFVVSNYDSSGNIISGDGTDWHYPTSVDPVSTSWTKYRFVVGPYGGLKDHSTSAKYISVGFIANYTVGTDVIYMTGFKCRPIPRYNNDPLTIYNNGSVGIGTTSPVQLLHVAGDINVSSGQGFRINNTATAGQYLRGNGTRFAAGTIDAGDIASGIISSGILGNSTVFVGTTGIALNRGTGAQTLTGVSIDGNAASVTDGVYTTGNQTIGGTKTFSSTIIGSINGNAATATNLSDDSGFVRNRSGVANEAALDSQTFNGFATVGYSGFSRAVWQTNTGGSVGTVQQEFDYTPARGWRIRMKTDNTSWTSWAHTTLTDSNQGILTGTVWTSGNDGAGSGLDADLLDGNHASAFYLASNPSGYTTNTGTVTSVATGDGLSGGTITTTGTLTVDSTVIRTTGNQDLSGVKTFYTPSGQTYNAASGNIGLSVFNPAAGDAMITYHIANDYAGYLGLGGAENDLVWTGWSVGSTRHRLVHSGNAASFVTTGVTAGNGLTGGGTVGALTLNVGAGDGISVAADSVAVDSSVVRTSGAQTIGGIKLFSDELRASANIIAYYTSDRRLKENISTMTHAIDKIKNIRGVNFDWTQDFMDSRGGEDGYFVRKNDVGVIAQEIQAILPQVVATREDGYLAVRYEKIVPLLIEAIKELSAKVDRLQKQVDGR